MSNPKAKDIQKLIDEVDRIKARLQELTRLYRYQPEEFAHHLGMATLELEAAAGVLSVALTKADE